MPTNEQRRANAKRKLQRQLERRAQQARRRRTLAIVGGSVAAAVVVAAIVVTVVLTNQDHNNKQASASGSSSTTATSGPVSGAPLPAFKATADLGANCQYPPSPEPAAKQVNPPRQGKVPTDPAQVSVSMVTNQGHIGLLLANNESPCTVNSFASLAQQKFFDGTKCHRLTTGDSSSILQCGDPSADGTGGPGYQFANEYPTDQYAGRRSGAQATRRISQGDTGDGQQRSEHQRQPVLSGVQGHAAAARIHHLRQDSAGRAGRPWTKSPRGASPVAARTARPPSKSPSPRHSWTYDDETHANRSRARDARLGGDGHVLHPPQIR